MDKNELKSRTKDFAHNCIRFASLFPKDRLSSHIEGQLVRCATSVAANYRAALLAQSKASFVAKISIVIEEVDESAFWIEFAIDENLISKEIAKPLFIEAKQLTSIFIATRKTIQFRK